MSDTLRNRILRLLIERKGIKNFFICSYCHTINILEEEEKKDLDKDNLFATLVCINCNRHQFRGKK